MVSCAASESASWSLIKFNDGLLFPDEKIKGPRIRSANANCERLSLPCFLTTQYFLVNSQLLHHTPGCFFSANFSIFLIPFEIFHRCSFFTLLLREMYDEGIQSTRLMFPPAAESFDPGVRPDLPVSSVYRQRRACFNQYQLYLSGFPRVHLDRSRWNQHVRWTLFHEFHLKRSAAQLSCERYHRGSPFTGDDVDRDT